MGAKIDEDVYDIPLELVELNRGEEYLALTDGEAGHVWLEAGRSRRPRVISSAPL